ncbi:helix-hairpin-helix domain-containing protein [Flavobacterium sp. Sd200]|uniref:ComEA family DNA-binding protein n=1 Tax=Flavobacterium sp. Sd200 TaxID=2692211 RepID=UPI001371A867|nr:helix-hairpin-helix domain-containing protein [Flavobacterium sp. Sd200]MXN91823.1 helix-hairpin-helix domain-containing protein [Flavobacterium sp. Sd200]
MHFYYSLTKDQRKGIIALCVVIIAVQVGYYFISNTNFKTRTDKTAEEKEWLALQTKIDGLKAKKGQKKFIIYPFNPNFITDHKGYTLGMSVEEIDRLHAYRDSGKWINTVADFKTVTKVSDSLLNKISPYFKFPDWVNKKYGEQVASNGSVLTSNKTSFDTKVKTFAEKKISKPLLDINTALEEDLIEVYGIGPAFAKKILLRRSDLGAFVSMDQMEDFKEFSPEAIAGLKKGFKAGENPQVATINVNTASLQQLSRFPYFNKDIAKAIITQRSMKGKIANFDELSKINDIFIDKSKIISLYLEY